MRHALLLASICLALAGFAAPVQAYTLVSREHGFSIELPEEPDYHGPRTITHNDKDYTGLGWDADRFSVHLFKLTPAMGGARFLGAPHQREGEVQGRRERQADPSGRGHGARRADPRHEMDAPPRLRLSPLQPARARLRGGQSPLLDRVQDLFERDAMDPEVTRVFDSFRILK